MQTGTTRLSGLRPDMNMNHLYKLSDDELLEKIWTFDTNVLVDEELYPRCKYIIKKGDFRITRDVIDELTKGKPAPRNSAWYKGRELAEDILKNHPKKDYRKTQTGFSQGTGICC